MPTRSRPKPPRCNARWWPPWSQLRHGARTGRLPAPLRQRLALASAQVVTQREALARASAALDRAIEVLLPSATPRGAYSAAGLSERPARAGMLQA